jgi:uncharacterized protein (TIRG00374 family)
MSKRVVSMAVAALVGIVLIYFAFRDVHIAEVLGSLKDFRPVWIPLLVLIPVLDLWVRAVRWRVLLAPSARASVGTLFQLEAIGLAINNVLFMRLGEVARAFITGRELNVPLMTVLATIVVERLCDMGALLLMLAVAAVLLPGAVHPQILFWSAVGALGIFAGLFVVTIGGERFKQSKLFAGLSRWPRLQRLAGDLITGTEGLRTWSTGGQVIGLSFVLWLADSGLYWAVARSMGFSPEMGYGQAVVTLSSAAAASALPAVPGAWGNFEAAVKQVLMHFGYGKALSLSYAAFVHMIMYVVVTALGLLFFYRLGHTLSGLREALEKRK